MSGFKVRKLTVSSVQLDDLGITLTGGVGTIVDLTYLEPTDIARSADLVAAINGTAPFSVAELVVVDARDNTDSTFFNAADSVEAVQRHNDTHLGISGGRFGGLDDPTAGFTDGHIVRYDLATDTFIACTPASFGPIVGSQGVDGVDTTYTYTATNVLHDAQDETFYDGLNNNGTFVGGPGTGPTNYAVNDVITMSDGSTVQVDAIDANGDVTQFTVLSSGNTGVTAGVPLTQTGVVPVGPGPQTGFTLTPQANNISTGTIQWDVDDVFLRNTGDTLDSGTLTIASGATVNFPAGSNLTINAAVNTATIDTPGGGFVNANDIINKGYVDALVQGIDWKESVRVATEPNGGPGADGDVGGTYATSPSNGQLTGVDLSSVTGDSIDGQFYTGNSATGLADGDRVLLKDQNDAKENGIYFIVEDAAGGTNTGDNVTLRRAPDQDGTPTSEVSGGNTTFVEDLGTVNSKTIWSVIWDGEVTLNTDPVNWSLTGAPTDILANEGLNSVVNEFNLDISTLTKTLTSIELNDVLAFDDVDGSDTTTDTTKITVANFISSRNIMVNPGTNGIIVNNGGTLSSVQIDHNGAGPLDGLEVTNGDGTAGNPTVGLDIQNLPARSTAVDTTDRVAVWRADGTNANEYYTIAEISGAVGASNSYTNWTNTGNGTGGPIGPGSSADTIDWNGGDGIEIDMTSGTPDTITISFSRAGLANTAVDIDDTFPFFDAGVGPHDPEYRSFRDAFTELNVPFGITGTGVVRKTGDSPDTYETIAIVASTDEDLDGLAVANGGTGDTGNIEIGLDIDGMTSASEDMAFNDEFPMHNTSVDTGGPVGSNQKMTGQEIADGVANILNITSLTFSTFQAVNTPAEDQTLLSYEDGGRTGDPILSVESHTFVYSDNSLSDNSWVSIGDAVDADSGYIMPFKGRIVGASVHCENVGGGNTFALDAVVSAADSTGAVATQIFSGLTGTNANDSDPDLDITFAAGQKLRVQADRTAGSGSMQDTVVTLFVKWES